MMDAKEKLYWSRKRYRQENKERIRQVNRDYREKNREKVREWNKVWREKNIVRHNECQRICHKGTVRERKEETIISMGGECSMCGYKYTSENFSAFDFHHNEPIKKERAVNWLLKNYKDEVSKCTLLCSNCHRILHQSEGGCYHARHGKVN